MDVEDVITLIDYIKDNNEDIYTELDRKFNKINEILNEIFNIVWEIRNLNKKIPTETNNDKKKENTPF